MGKKIICSIMALLMASTLFCCLSFAEDTTLKVENATLNTDTVTIKNGTAEQWLQDSYIGFSDVDLTGVKSIKMRAKEVDLYNKNGEAFGVYIDDPLKGECIGYIVLNDQGPDIKEYGMNLKKEISGKHDLYIKQNYTGSDTMYVYEIILSQSKWEDPNKVTPVPDSQIIDNYSDTWTAVDAVGRKLADYEEVGPVKDGTHEVLLFYHDWHTGGHEATVASDVFAKFPEARDDYDHPAWKNGGVFWGESVYGFYTSYDYWHYRKAAELMADAGVDAVFLDYTNWDNAYIKALNVMMQAYHDAREDGVDVPKISAYMQMGQSGMLNLNMLKAVYFNLFENEYYSDLWYYVDGKPFIIQQDVAGVINYANPEDTAEVELTNKIINFFNYRGTGDRHKGVGWNGQEAVPEGFWHWLCNYPQPKWGGVREDGRTECMTLGVAINESYEYGSAYTGVFSDEYTKGRSYTEGFGEDYRPEAMHQGYFFKEQASRVLETDPWYVFVDGWNEWTTGRSKDYYNGRFPNAFIDLMDDENSRDFEPSKGALKDDYYNLLVDFVRKYKGVRPAPTASEPVTIDINGDASQWDNVGPEYINDYGGYERDDDGFYVYDGNGEVYHYTTEVVNSISRSKVARDSENFYFYVKCDKDIVIRDSASMNLYINIDRNYSTGWEGYDLLVSGGNVSKFADGEYKLQDIGAVEYRVSGNVMMLKLSKSLIGDLSELEFKWTDNIAPEGDLMKFYSEGNAAPVGRFNYLYTEREQKALTREERAKVSDISIVKAGTQKMIVKGGIMNVYDKDIRVSCFESAGTIYIPITAVEEIMGYGTAKAYYNYDENMIFIKAFDLLDKTDRKINDYIEKEITNEQWICNVLGSNEMFVDGKLQYTTPAISKDGVIYIPASMLADGFGCDVKPLGNGAYAISKNVVNEAAAIAVASYIY